MKKKALLTLHLLLCLKVHLHATVPGFMHLINTSKTYLLFKSLKSRVGFNKLILQRTVNILALWTSLGHSYCRCLFVMREQS